MTYTVNLELYEEITDFWWKFLNENRERADQTEYDLIHHANETLKSYNARMYRIERNVPYDVYVDFPSEEEYMKFILRYS